MLLLLSLFVNLLFVPVVHFFVSLTFNLFSLFSSYFLYKKIVCLCNTLGVCVPDWKDEQASIRLWMKWNMKNISKEKVEEKKK